MRKILNGIPKYWLFQLLGWGLFTGINIFFAISFNLYDPQFVARLAVYVVVGVIFTHLMRTCIKSLRLLDRNTNWQLFGFLFLSLFFSLIIGGTETYLGTLFHLEYKEELKLDGFQKASSNIFTSFVYLFIWNCIYFIYHYVEQSRKNQLDKLRLEASVKALELKTIKSHINPHFIFNALNSIRALIDEDPARARQAVTALSNILRSSMLSDQQETIPLEKELNIVRDYLDLELIRFEDRLKLSYQIDEDTLDDLVPPMMLQMLVENAIKHGIGKSVHPGEIRITAIERHQKLILSVVNTGHLQDLPLPEGFGIQSTANRLNLIFGNSASFRIHQLNPEMVEALVEISLN
jgi:two-component system LytT family sensor kinase